MDAQSRTFDTNGSRQIPERHRRHGFSLAELLVVVGIIALLLALTLPTLNRAHQQAMETRCAGQLQQLGQALSQSFTDNRFYPMWDDGGAPVRYTWIDVLVERGYLPAPNISGPDGQRAARTGPRVGYCPADAMPDPLNIVRHRDLIYPPTQQRGGVDYSYGIGAPLAAGGWAWQAPADGSGDGRPRRFRGYERDTSGRVLAGDAYSPVIYNLGGRALESYVWNDPTQFDNTVAWGRHPGSSAGQGKANLLYQDGHVAAVSYVTSAPHPVNTAKSFVWYPGESLYIGPEDTYEGNWYPNQAPSVKLAQGASAFPQDLIPAWYTLTQSWKRISHK